MAIEGLQVVLDKEPVVPTPDADQLVTAPQTVETAFVYHVRSYVPFGRQAGADDESDAISIADYEKRLIAKVKAKAAPKGYITADFGYGKTSTALYVWDRCRQAGLLAVPPFKLRRLDDLIHASYGWARHELTKTAPALVPDLEALYGAYRERSIESMASGDAALAEKLRELLAAGHLTLDLGPTDYATFFEKLVALVDQAGFAGVVVLADELQQYLDPVIRGGRGDPIAPLFNIVEALNTRRGHLPFGLVFNLLRKDFGVINDQRGDFIMRLKDDKLGLDLSTIYDKRFATRLWDRLADEFAFTAEAPKIVSPAALDALGQIAARDDLANGPRTVIDAFRWMTRRFLDGATAPVSPLDLVDAFLAGQLVFDGTSKLQSVALERLNAPLVAGRDDLRRVVKALAAFPTDGAQESVLRDLGLWEGAQELDRLARGDVTIMVGGGLDDRGERVPYGYTLRGLEPQSAVAQDWLTQTLREFSHNFVDATDTTLTRMEAGFARMLTDVVFKAPHWKRLETTGRRRSDGTNRSLLFEGSFPATTKRYPERRVLVRILRDKEKPEPIRDDVDLTLEITLSLTLDADDRKRRTLPGTFDQAANRRARLTLNLFHRESEDYYPDLQQALQPVVSPNRVTPLLMLALHEYLEEKRAAHLIPKENDGEIESFYQPRLLEHSVEELFNAELGAPFNARGPRVVEALFRALIEARYPDYKTVIRQSGWTSALSDYRLALDRLETRHERQGAVDVEATKEDTARLFNRANTALDAFLGNFPELLSVDPEFRGRQPSKVRFRLHPFEEHVRRLLQKGETITVATAGRKVPVKVIKLSLVEDAGNALGYRQREIGALLDVMSARELIEVSTQHGTVQEVAHVAVGIEDVRRRVAAAIDQTNALLTAFPDDSTLPIQLGGLQKKQRELNDSAALDEASLLNEDRILRNLDKLRGQLLANKLEALRASAKAIAIEGTADLRQSHRLADPIAGAFFAPQLDAIRSKVLTDANAYRSQEDDLKRRKIAVIGQLSAEEPTVDSVIAAHEEVAALRRDAQRFESEGRKLDVRGRRLMTARRVLGRAIELGDALHHDESAADDPDLGVAFRSETAQIQAELSSRKEAALEGAERWETALGDLRNLLSAKMTEARDAFAARQTRYVELLRANAGIPPDRDALSLAFNAADPAGSWTALANEVSTLLSDRLGRISTHANRAKGELLALLASGQLEYVDDADTHETRCRALVQTLSEASETASTLRHHASDPATVADIDGRFVALLEDIAGLFQQVAHDFKDAEQLLAAVEPVKLNGPEQRVLDRLHQLAASNGALLDIGVLLEDRSPREATAQGNLWGVLEQLYRKRRVSIHVGVHRAVDQP